MRRFDFLAPLFCWRTVSLLFSLIAGLSFDHSTTAMTTQVAMFTGFGALPNAGMDILNSELSGSDIPNYEGMVFGWTERQEASDWILQQSQRLTLVLIGHSFGGNSALQLANDFLKPLGIDVDLTIQVDPVKNFFPGSNNQLPSNVDVGFNYYQKSTGLFEPQGEDFVQGATNINAEVLFNDTSITHNSLDDDPRLFALIGQHILDNLNQENADFDMNNLVDGNDFLTWQRGFGITGQANLSTGDANGDKEVDDKDLFIWQQQFGSGSDALGSLASSQTVPEPSGLALVMISLASWMPRRRSCSKNEARNRTAH